MMIRKKMQTTEHSLFWFCTKSYQQIYIGILTLSESSAESALFIQGLSSAYIAYMQPAFLMIKICLMFAKHACDKGQGLIHAWMNMRYLFFRWTSLTFSFHLSHVLSCDRSMRSCSLNLSSQDAEIFSSIWTDAQPWLQVHFPKNVKTWLWSKLVQKLSYCVVSLIRLLKAFEDHVLKINLTKIALWNNCLGFGK